MVSWACRDGTRDFCSALAALVGTIQNIFLYYKLSLFFPPCLIFMTVFFFRAKVYILVAQSIMFSSLVEEVHYERKTTSVVPLSATFFDPEIIYRYKSAGKSAKSPFH